jgi:hypothetical protein
MERNLWLEPQGLTPRSTPRPATAGAVSPACGPRASSQPGLTAPASTVGVSSNVRRHVHLHCCLSRPNMQIRRIALVLSLVAFATGSAQSPAPSGAALAAALQDGVWCNSEDGGRSCAAFDEFHADGRLTSCGKFSFDRRPFTASAKYEISGRRACVQVTESSPNFALRAGERFCVEVLEMTKELQRYRSEGSTEVSVLYRRPKAAKLCPGERA